MAREDSIKQWSKFFYSDFVIVADIGVKSRGWRSVSVSIVFTM